MRSRARGKAVNAMASLRAEVSVRSASRSSSKRAACMDAELAERRRQPLVCTIARTKEAECTACNTPPLSSRFSPPPLAAPPPAAATPAAAAALVGAQCSLRSASMFIATLIYCSSTERVGCSPSLVQPLRLEHEPPVLLHRIMRCMSSTCIGAQADGSRDVASAASAPPRRLGASHRPSAASSFATLDAIALGAVLVEPVRNSGSA